MALSKIKTKLRDDRDDIYRRMVAEQIVANFKLSDWRFAKGHCCRTTGSDGSALTTH